MLATHCKDNPWNYIHKVCFAYNTSVHASTGYAPFYLMYGCQATLPVDFQYGTVQSHEADSQTEYVAELNQPLSSAFKLVRNTAGVQHERQKEYYDRKATNDSYAIDNLVWVLNSKVPKNSSKKLFHPWSGPFIVIKKFSERTYRVQKQEDVSDKWYILTD